MSAARGRPDDARVAVPSPPRCAGCSNTLGSLEQSRTLSTSDVHLSALASVCASPRTGSVAGPPCPLPAPSRAWPRREGQRLCGSGACSGSRWTGVYGSPTFADSLCKHSPRPRCPHLHSPAQPRGPFGLPTPGHACATRDAGWWVGPPHVDSAEPREPAGRPGPGSPSWTI